MKNSVILPQQCFTHGGTFHADDVFSTALLKIMRPDIKVIRGFTVPKNFDGIVFDIGGGKFDHHKAPRETRPNGVPYAAFGKLWREFGPILVGKDQAEWLDRNFVQRLDNADNGGPTDALSGAIAGMNPLWNSDESCNELFEKTVEMAVEILKRQIEVCESHNSAAEELQKAKKQPGNIVILDRYVPIINELAGSDKKFVIFPSIRGGWNAQVVPIDRNSRTASLPFPSEWWGAPEKVLPAGVTFCHASGFMLAAETKEAAIHACRIAIEKKKNANSNRGSEKM